MGWLWMASYFEGQRVNRSIGSDILTCMVTRLRFRVCRVKASWMPRCAVTPRLQTAVKLWRLGLAGNHLELQVSSSPVYPKTFWANGETTCKILVLWGTPISGDRCYTAPGGAWAPATLATAQRWAMQTPKAPSVLSSFGDMNMDQNPPGTPQILAYFWN